jgi:hypothetical protein
MYPSCIRLFLEKLQTNLSGCSVCTDWTRLGRQLSRKKWVQRIGKQTKETDPLSTANVNCVPVVGLSFKLLIVKQKYTISNKCGSLFFENLCSTSWNIFLYVSESQCDQMVCWHLGEGSTIPDTTVAFHASGCNFVHEERAVAELLRRWPLRMNRRDSLGMQDSLHMRGWQLRSRQGIWTSYLTLEIFNRSHGCIWCLMLGHHTTHMT